MKQANKVIIREYALKHERRIGLFNSLLRRASISELQALGECMVYERVKFVKDSVSAELLFRKGAGNE